MTIYYIYDLKNDTQPHQVDFENAPVILKNEQVLERYREIKRYCPYDERITDYFDIYYQPNKVLYFSLKNIESMTKVFLNEHPLIKTIIDRHIKHSNYLINDDGFQYICDRFGKVSQNNYLNLVEQPEEIKTKLYDYQRDNLKWMMDNENQGIDVDFTEHKFCIMDDGRIYDYYVDEFITDRRKIFTSLKIRGGILMDDVGIGKTIQALALICSNLVNTLIIVPNHLVDHWHEQIRQHVSADYSKAFHERVRIVNFDDARNELLEANYKRIVVDEIHETFNNNGLVETLCHYNCDFKWGLTATPWVHNNALYFLFTFLSKHRFIYNNAIRMSYYYQSYNKLFRKNTKQNIQKEVYLPAMHVYNMLIQFSEAERNLYEIEKSTNEHCHVDFLRELCGCIDMDTEFYTSQLIMSHFESSFLKEEDLLKKYEQSIQSIRRNLEEVRQRMEAPESANREQDEEAVSLVNQNLEYQELEQNLVYYENMFEKQERVTHIRKRAFERYKEGLEKIDNIINSEKKEECIICYSEMNEKIAYYKCGHYFCHECVYFIRRGQNFRCPYCRAETSDKELFVLTKKKSSKYNSKINRMLELINCKNEKFIIYTQFEKVLSLLASVFMKEGKPFKIYKPNMRIDPETSLLLINNVNNASGIDLTSFNNIIIFEPFQDEKCIKYVEQQMIGRIYRIGQKKETNVYRLIIKNTIESDIYNISA